MSANSKDSQATPGWHALRLTGETKTAKDLAPPLARRRSTMNVGGAP